LPRPRNPHSSPACQPARPIRRFKAAEVSSGSNASPGCFFPLSILLVAIFHFSLSRRPIFFSQILSGRPVVSANVGHSFFPFPPPSGSVFFFSMLLRVRTFQIAWPPRPFGHWVFQRSQPASFPFPHHRNSSFFGSPPHSPSRALPQAGGSSRLPVASNFFFC